MDRTVPAGFRRGKGLNPAAGPPVPLDDGDPWEPALDLRTISEDAPVLRNRSFPAGNGSILSPRNSDTLAFLANMRS